MNPLNKLGKKISKAFGGAGGRRQSVGLDDAGSLQQEDSRHHDSVSTSNGAASPNARPQDDKNFVQQISHNVEHFIKSITDTPRPHAQAQPLRSSVPEGEDDERDDDKAGDSQADVEPPPPDLDENTPVPVLLARIEFLETSLRSETDRANALEERIQELDNRLHEMEQVAHRSILARVLRPFRACFGG